MNENDLKIFADKLRGAKSILIMGHKNPDGDSLCSVAALARLIEINYGRRPVCVYDGNVPDNLDSIPLRGYVKYYERADLTQPFDLAIVLDYGTANHLGGPAPVIAMAKYVIEIDHHKNDEKIAALCLDDDTAAATGAIIYEIMRALDWRYDGDVQTLLATAILTDTGHFKFARDGRTLRIMAELVDGGVSIRGISDMLANKQKKTVLTEAAVASRAEFFYHGRMVLATVMKKDYKYLDGRGEIILNLLSQIRGVDYVVLLKQQKEDQIGFSMRGRGRAVNHFAAAMGGGGHEFAAGGVVRGQDLETVRTKIIELFRGI